jgi:hypothetical protein
MSPLKTKIPSKNMREKPTNTPIILSQFIPRGMGSDILNLTRF